MGRTKRKPHIPGRTRKRHRKHDQSYKHLFREPRAVAALIRDFAAKDWAHELDLTTLRRFPTENVGPDLKRRLCDCAWQVQFKNGRSVVFLFEFQASGDPDMALRMLRYTEGALSALRGNKALLDPDGAVPPVLSFVVNTGPRPWGAATTVSELTGERDMSPTLARTAADLEVRHEYRVLDLQLAFAQDLLPEDSLLHWLAALERDPWTSFLRVHRALAEHWGGPECLAARQAFAAWTMERMLAADVPEAYRSEIKERIEQPTEAEEMGQTYAEWAESHRQQGLEQGLERGIEQGLQRGMEQGLERGMEQGLERGMEQGLERGRTEGRAMLVRLASRRFGAETAKQLAGLVGGMGVEELARVGDAVVDCDTGDELLAVAGNGATEGG